MLSAVRCFTEAINLPFQAETNEKADEVIAGPFMEDESGAFIPR